MLPKKVPMMLIVLLSLSLLATVFALTDCSKKEPPPPKPMAPMDFNQTAPFNADNPPAAPGAPGGPGGGVGAPNEKCRNSCKNICVRAKQCNLPGFSVARRCARACMAICGRGLLDQKVTDCIKPDTKCNEVGKCLNDLRQQVKQLREKMQQNKPGAPPENPPAEPEKEPALE